MKPLAAAVAALFASAPAAAAPGDLATLSLEQLLDVRVVTASRVSQRQAEAPAAVTVVTAEDIRLFGHRSLADVLNTVPGVYITDDRAYSYVGARGFNRVGDYNTRYLLLVDGNRISDNIYDQAYVGREFPLDIDLVERVEVAAGPGSSVYGGGAFFGVINVITKRAAAIGGTQIAGSVGSYRTGAGRASFGQTFANGAEVVASVSGLRGFGDRPYYVDFDSPATNNGLSPEDAYRERVGQAFVSAIYGGLSVQAGQGMRRKNGAALYPTSDFTGTGYYNQDRLTWGSVTYDGRLSARTTTTVRAFAGRYDYIGNYPSLPPLASTNRDTALGQWYGAEARFVSTLSPSHRLSGGIELQRDSRLQQRNFDLDPAADYLDDDRRAYRVGLFVQDEYGITEKLRVNAGVRLDRNSLFGAATSPRIALIYAASPQTTYKLLYGRAFRPPTLYEAFYGAPVLGQAQNPDLKPERIASTEAIVERVFSRTTRGRISAFQYRIDDLIGITDDGSGNTIYRNAAAAQGRGVEIAASYQAPTGLRLQGSWSWHLAQIEDVTRARPSNSPKQLAKLAAADSIWGDRIRPALEAFWISPRLDRNGADVPSLLVANATLGLPRLWKRGYVSIGVYNLFDRKNVEPISDISTPTTVPSLGRTWRLKVQTTF